MIARSLVWVAALAFAAAACADGPRQVHLGEDGCAHCHMTITDDRFTAQLVTDRGRSYLFDSIECMAEFLSEAQETGDAPSGALWVTDFNAPGKWIDAGEALFLRSPELRSPMGLNLSAYADREAVEAQAAELGGEVLNWNQVMELVRREGVRPMGGHAADHGAAQQEGMSHAH
jgi:copper chaperone NosL